MKKVFIAISLLLLSSGSRLAAQTIMDSNTAYKEFVRLANEDTDKVLTYDALYRCYAATYVVMTTSEKTSSEYSQATYNMTHILPFLPNAAAFYSRGMSAGNAVKFARAFVDVANLPAFADGGYRSQTAYAQLSYYAAASLVNQRQYEEAIPYLQSYIRSGEDKYRKTVFINLVKACAASNQYDLAIVTLEQATENYPTDYDFVSAAVNLCIDHNDNERLQHFVSKGLALQPEDATLLNIQGKLYEEKREFKQALSVYQKLQETHPKALDVLKHLAINSYNLGVENYNKTLELREDPNVLFYEAEAKEYFTQAIDHLRNILISDPLSLKYTQALAVAYICTGDKENFGLVNYKLASLGGGKIEENVIPRFIDFVQEAGPTVAAIPSADAGDQQESLAEGQLQGIPAYSAFAVPFIESRIGKWQEKDPYETLDEYRNRVTEQSREEKLKEMQQLAQQEFISLYETRVNLRHLELRPYDAENEVFLVTSPEVGEMIIPVPRSNDEAKIFASNWNGMQFKDPKYFIDNDHLAIASLTIITPSGKRYQYDNAAALNYTVTNVDVHFDPINADMLAANSSINQQTIKEQNVKLGSRMSMKTFPRRRPTTRGPLPSSSQTSTIRTSRVATCCWHSTTDPQWRNTATRPWECRRRTCATMLMPPMARCCEPYRTSSRLRPPSMETSISSSIMRATAFLTSRRKTPTFCRPTRTDYRQRAATRSTGSTPNWVLQAPSRSWCSSTLASRDPSVAKECWPWHAA